MQVIELDENSRYIVTLDGEWSADEISRFQQEFGEWYRSDEKICLLWGNITFVKIPLTVKIELAVCKHCAEQIEFRGGRWQHQAFKHHPAEPTGLETKDG